MPFNAQKASARRWFPPLFATGIANDYSRESLLSKPFTDLECKGDNVTVRGYIDEQHQVQPVAKLLVQARSCWVICILVLFNTIALTSLWLSIHREERNTAVNDVFPRGKIHKLCVSFSVTYCLI